MADFNNEEDDLALEKSGGSYKFRKVKHDAHKHSGFERVLECCAFFGIACVAVALLIATCFSGDNAVYNVFRSIGDAVVYILSMILAFFYVKRKTHIAWTICYVIFVVLIVVLYIIGAIKSF